MCNYVVMVHVVWSFIHAFTSFSLFLKRVYSSVSKKGNSCNTLMPTHLFVLHSLTCVLNPKINVMCCVSASQSGNLGLWYLSIQNNYSNNSCMTKSERVLLGERSRHFPMLCPAGICNGGFLEVVSFKGGRHASGC